MTTHTPVQLKDYSPPEFLIDQVTLVFDIQPEQTRVTSTLAIRRNPDKPRTGSCLSMDMGVYEILSVSLDGRTLSGEQFQADGTRFAVPDVPDRFTLEIQNTLFPEKNTRLEGLYRSNLIYCTQCEAEGFRHITPFVDRPDVMAKYACTIMADKTACPVLLSNGNPVDQGDLPDHRHYVTWEDPFRKPCYLFALVAGDLSFIESVFTTKSGRQILLKIFAEPENIDKCHHAMACLKQAVKWDEDRFNLEYDLDLYQIVAIKDFNAGAMENKGLNIFNAKYVLADPATATDEDFMNILRVIGHEYFHNWTGNRVTLKNWFQLSLKEGLTVFRDQEFTSDLNARSVERIRNVSTLRSLQFPEDSGPMAHPVRPDAYIKMDNFYTMTVYEKGAELIRMIHQLLGETAFQRGMALYFDTFDGMAVTVEDFLSVMAQAGNLDLTQFKRWYTQSGTPEVTVTRSYDSDTRTLSVFFSQHTSPDRNQPEKQPLHIPVRMALIDPDGNEILPKQGGLIQMTDKTRTEVFENVPKDSLPSVFRQFSAPVKIATDLTDQELAFLMARDTDDFNRWDAAQTLFKKEIQRLVTDIVQDRPLTVSPTLVQAFEAALSDGSADRAFLAKALAIPQETDLADLFETIDVDAIHTARQHLKTCLAGTLSTLFQQIFDRCSHTDPNSLSIRDIGKRSLRNLALSYMAALDTASARATAWDAFQNADNMTDEFAGFKIICTTTPDLKQKSAARFYDRWSHDCLVMDKWFYVQAVSPLPGTLASVMDLVNHPDFNLTNPNRVRALIYGFAMNNPICFHDRTGKGYTFVTENILALDRINHQIAARLARSFNQWKKYDPHRRALMKQSLETLAAAPDLSTNVYEIVSRALE
ncbi:MAG: aminopeptidase N [Desulfotignum sp.]